jgi:uncharacterized small protein (DUF1192 family)
MLVDEGDRPKKKILHEIGQDISLLSVFELKERVEMMKAEIIRLEAAAVAKDAAKNAADSFFRK